MRNISTFFKKFRRPLVFAIPALLTSSSFLILLVTFGMLLGLITKSQLSTTDVKEKEFTVTQETSESQELQTDNFKLPITGQKEKWKTYKDASYGYSFDYPMDLKVKQTPSNGNVSDTIKLDFLSISTFYSDAVLNFDFDEGLDKSLYNEPRRTMIGGELFYFIISKIGNIQMLAYDYKYIEDILWVKTERKLLNASSQSYYISFKNDAPKKSSSKEQVYELESIFETFEF